MSFFSRLRLISIRRQKRAADAIFSFEQREKKSIEERLTQPLLPSLPPIPVLTESTAMFLKPKTKLFFRFERKNKQTHRTDGAKSRRINTAKQTPTS